MIDLSRNGDVFVLQLDRADNRVHPELLAALDGALDEVERCAEPVALVTTGCGRFYSNGLDIERLAPAKLRSGSAAGPDAAGDRGRTLAAVTLRCRRISACRGAGQQQQCDPQGGCQEYLADLEHRHFLERFTRAGPREASGSRSDQIRKV